MYLIKLSTGDAGLVVNDHLIMTANPAFENPALVEDAAEKLAAATGVGLTVITAGPPQQEDWTWDDVLAQTGLREPLKPFRVTLHEEPGDKHQIVFDCKATDADHAAEQAENAHPGGEVINTTQFEGNLPVDSWLRSLNPGQEVWWNDPDNHRSSGIYTVEGILFDKITDDDDMLVIRNDAGSVAEVLAHELSPSKPDNLFEVVYGGETYGYAADAEAAVEVVGPTKAAFAVLEENVQIGDAAIPKAWVVREGTQEDDRCTLNLVLSITYKRNGVSVGDLSDRLLRVVDSAFADGMLTGDTPAEVEDHSADISIIDLAGEE